MKNRKQKTIDMEKGFTLIELLLVIAIVTLLSSAFFYSSTQARNKAEDAHMKMEAKQVETAISMYKEDNNGQVPHYGSLESGKLYREGDNNDDYENNMDLLVEDGYLSEIPTSPDGNSYAYGFTSDFLDSLFIVDLNTEETDLIVGDEDAIISFENNPPEPPVITGNKVASEGEENTYSFVARDPDGDQIKYEIDWDLDENIDLILPSVGLVDSETSLFTIKSFSELPSAFRARTQDKSGAVSGWRSFVVDMPGSNYEVNCSNYVGTIDYTKTITAIILGGTADTYEWVYNGNVVGNSSSFSTSTLPLGRHEFTLNSTSTDRRFDSGGCYIDILPNPRDQYDRQIPIITTFEIPESTLTDSEDLWGPSKPKTITISNFSGTDNVGITGYLITENPTEPSKNNPNWSSTKPTSYTIENPEIENSTTINLYAWLKDEAGNISLSQNDSTIIYFLVLSPP